MNPTKRKKIARFQEHQRKLQEQQQVKDLLEPDEEDEIETLVETEIQQQAKDLLEPDEEDENEVVEEFSKGKQIFSARKKKKTLTTATKKNKMS